MDEFIDDNTKTPQSTKPGEDEEVKGFWRKINYSDIKRYANEIQLQKNLKQIIFGQSESNFQAQIKFTYIHMFSDKNSLSSKKNTIKSMVADKTKIRKFMSRIDRMDVFKKDIKKKPIEEDSSCTV